MTSPESAVPRTQLPRTRARDAGVPVLRAAAGIAALLIAGLAARAGGVSGLPRTGWRLPWLHGTLTVILLVAAVAVAIAFVAFVALLARRPRRRRDQPPLPVLAPFGSRSGRIAAMVVAVAIVAVPVGFVVGAQPTGPSQPRRASVAAQPTVAPSAGTTRRPEAARPASAKQGSQAEVIALVALVAVAAAAALAAVVRGGGQSAPKPPDETPPPGDAAVVAEALAGGAAAAGRALADAARSPREAVIAAYGAMATSLAAHGPLRSSDTPGRLLRRAGDLALIRPADGRVLVDLFERARFSPHPVTVGDQAAAEQALAAVLAQLGATRPQGVPP